MNMTAVLAALIAAADLGAQGAPMGHVAQALAEAGLAVFPCSPTDKKPLTAHGFHDRTNDAEQVAKWWAQWPAAAPGIVPGDAGLAALDVDSPSAFAAAQAAGAIPANLLDTLRTRAAGEPLDCDALIIETGGTSTPFNVDGVMVPPLHVYVRANGASPRVKGVVVRYDKGYVIAPGGKIRKPYALLARGTPAPYTPPPEPAPVLAVIVAPLATDLDPARVRAALMTLPNTGDAFAARDRWVGVAHMLRGALGDAGRDLWLEWCAQYPTAKPEEDARVFDTLPASLLGWPALVALASQYGFQATPAERAALAQTEFAPVADAPVAPTAAVPAIDIGYMLRELMARPELLAPPKVIIPKLAWVGQKTILSSREKIGKTTLLYAGIAAATRGDDFLGEPTTRIERALILTEEALAHPTRRAGALMHADPDRVRIVPMGMNPRAQLKEAVLRWRPDFVLVDTLYRYSGVEDENASGVWHPIFAEFDVLTRRGITLVIAVHAIKGSKDGKYRGSSALGGFVDVILEMAEPTAGSVVRNIYAKARIPVEQQFAVKYDEPTSSFALLSEQQDQAAADANKVRKLLREKPMLKTDLRDELDCGMPRVNAALKKLGAEAVKDKDSGKLRLCAAADDFAPEGSAR
jgi:bifunctional DNA primase/polymerase-like protein/AAA domain-containing protein